MNTGVAGFSAALLQDLRVFASFQMLAKSNARSVSQTSARPRVSASRALGRSFSSEHRAEPAESSSSNEGRRGVQASVYTNASSIGGKADCRHTQRIGACIQASIHRRHTRSSCKHNTLHSSQPGAPSMQVLTSWAILRKVAAPPRHTRHKTASHKAYCCWNNGLRSTNRQSQLRVRLPNVSSKQ